MALKDSNTNDEASATSFASTTYHDGQTWTTTSAYTIYQVKLKFYRHATTNPGNVTCYIYATSGSLPTGSASCTSAAVDCSGITTDTAGEEVTFTFESGAELSDATEYAIVILSSNSSPCIYWKVNYSYGDGQAVRAGSPTWYANSSIDHWFETYDEDVEEYVDIAGVIAETSSLLGTISLYDIKALSGTITRTSTLSGAIIVSSNWQTDTFQTIKRLVIIGNNSLYYEDV